MQVLIIGATGHVGLETVRYGLEEGYRVKAFGRSTDKITLQSDTLFVVKGDATNRTDVAKALHGVDVVILTHGAPLKADTILHEPDLMKKSTALIVDEMAKAGVSRLICMTSLGAGDSEGHGRLIFQKFIEPVLLGRILKDRTAQEEIVRAAALPEWVIVRPTELTDGDSKPVRVIHDLDQEEEPKMINRTDVARFLISLVANKTHDSETIVITN